MSSVGELGDMMFKSELGIHKYFYKFVNYPKLTSDERDLLIMKKNASIEEMKIKYYREMLTSTTSPSVIDKIKSEASKSEDRLERFGQSGAKLVRITGYEPEVLINLIEMNRK